MTANMKRGKRNQVEWLPPLFKGYIYSTAILLVAIGATLFLVTWTCKVRGIQSFLNAPDRLFGFSNRNVLLLAGILHLILGGCLFVRRDLIIRGLLTLWAGLNCLLYRMAMVWAVGMKAPYPMEEFVGWRLGINKETVDICWKFFIVCLIVGSSVLMLLNVLFKWRQEKQFKEEAWFKGWQETRSQDRLPAKPAGPQKIPADAANYLKMSCALCNGHIAFSPENLGQKIPCPHCKATVTLMKPKNIKTACSACGGHIEFPLHGLGQIIACPHCSTPIKLQMSACLHE